MTALEQLRNEIYQLTNLGQYPITFSEIEELIIRFENEEKNIMKECYFEGLFQASKMPKITAEESFEKFYKSNYKK